MANTTAPRQDAPPRAKAPAPLGAGTVRNTDVFRRAERHSRRVRALKIWLPGLALLGVGGFVAWSFLSVPSVDGFAVQGSAITDGKLVMASPKLDGFTRDNLPYSMTALRAVQDLKQTGVITLEEIDAKVPLTADNTAQIVSRSGIYDSNKNTLVIDSAVTVTTTDGMVAKLLSADVDIAAGRMSTAKPVDIQLDGSHISADSLTVSENGKVLVFDRRVRVEIEPKQASGATTGKGVSDAAN